MDILSSQASLGQRWSICGVNIENQLFALLDLLQWKWIYVGNGTGAVPEMANVIDWE